MVLAGVATAVAPWCRNLPFLMSMTLVQGIPLGILDAGKKFHLQSSMVKKCFLMITGLKVKLY